MRAAIQAHEAARPRVAIEQRMLINELPAFAERVCCNDVHVHVIESRGSKPLDRLKLLSQLPKEIFHVPFMKDAITSSR